MHVHMRGDEVPWGKLYGMIDLCNVVQRYLAYRTIARLSKYFRKIRNTRMKQILQQFIPFVILSKQTIA